MLPPWIRKRVPGEEVFLFMEKILSPLSLYTICKEARCPNIGDCFREKQVTFLLLGDGCTRRCGFCGVKKKTRAFDPAEGKRAAEGIKRVGLEYVVLTSPTRDDLPDEGGEGFVRAIREIKKIGKEKPLERILKEKIDVLGHTLETIPRLYPEIGPGADYLRSLKILKKAKGKNPFLLTKTALLLGLGEEKEEILEVMEDLKKVGCDILILSQYLRPSPLQKEVKRYISPSEFKEYEEEGRRIGLRYVRGEPFFRSSYRAKEIFFELKRNGKPSFK